MSFGMGMSLNQVVNYAARYGDNLVVGRWLGTATLGLYSRAYSLMMLPQTYFTMALSSVLFPAFCEGGDDPRRLARGYLLAVQVSAIIAAPMMVVMIVAAPHLVVALYGPAWVGAVVPMQILCAVGVLRTVYHVSGALIKVRDGSIPSSSGNSSMRAGLGGRRGRQPYGITGVAVGVSAAIVYMYLAMARLEHPDHRLLVDRILRGADPGSLRGQRRGPHRAVGAPGAGTAGPGEHGHPGWHLPGQRGGRPGGDLPSTRERPSRGVVRPGGSRQPEVAAAGKSADSRLPAGLPLSGGVAGNGAAAAIRPHPKVVICVISYRRPKGLARLLAALETDVRAAADPGNVGLDRGQRSRRVCCAGQRGRRATLRFPSSTDWNPGEASRLPGTPQWACRLVGRPHRVRG